MRLRDVYSDLGFKKKYKKEMYKMLYFGCTKQVY